MTVVGFGWRPMVLFVNEKKSSSEKQSSDEISFLKSMSYRLGKKKRGAFCNFRFRSAFKTKEMYLPYKGTGLKIQCKCLRNSANFSQLMLRSCSLTDFTYLDNFRYSEMTP
ncbi:hypothetical protein TNCT_543101 [Trichonephila clavata]|uniref:Uncharacterized protein n=1 Tax=Trichonephila clavata TaxID=2740835 RepID=A0A8X6GZJ5_TRICU|nr:hypothetical protein TNCT_543101 [Trichonephila clavata]